MSDNPMLRFSLEHEQTPRTRVYYVKNRFKRRQRWRRVVEDVTIIPTVEQISDVSRLMSIIYAMRARAGQAPGPDGVTYTDLGGPEIANIMRGLSAAVRAGTYRPGPTRPVQVPKLKGGYRTLSLGNICDRVLATSLHKALKPLWESIFLPCSMGFRSARGVWHMLSEIVTAMTSQDLWVIAQDDVQNAFPSVVIRDVLSDHARYLQDPSLLSLIRVVLQGNDRKRHRGIDQGSPYSPTALNVRLHHAVDLAVHQGHHPCRYYRYADNLVWLSRHVSEGHKVLGYTRRLLEKAGFTLKRAEVKDLRYGQTTELLGFCLTKRGGELCFELGSDAWIKLEQDLRSAHESPNPVRTAQAVVQGWVRAYGPAFRNWRTPTLDRILQTGARLGFREIASRESLADLCEVAWRNWETFRSEREPEATVVTS